MHLEPSNEVPRLAYQVMSVPSLALATLPAHWVYKSSEPQPANPPLTVYGFWVQAIQSAGDVSLPGTGYWGA